MAKIKAVGSCPKEMLELVRNKSLLLWAMLSQGITGPSHGSLHADSEAPRALQGSL